MRLLTQATILAALEALARELDSDRGRPRPEILIAGGAALVLLYGAREATRDVDALAASNVEAAELREAVRRVAEAEGLPDDWLDDGAKAYLNGLLPGRLLFDRPGLAVRALAPPQLLAMKLSAWRDDVDIADARLLLHEVAGTREEVWRSVEPFVVPGRELKARYAFEDLWEAEHGSQGSGTSAP